MLRPNTKSIARIAAVQAMYQYHTLNQEADIKTILLRLKKFYKDPKLNSDYEFISNDIRLKPSYKHLEELLSLLEQNLNIINDIIKSHLSGNWTLENLSLLLYSILQIAITELKYFPEIPYKVIINEYTNIASDMISEKEVGFVNSLLDNYYVSNHDK